MCKWRTWAFTARSMASASKAFAAADRPTRPEYFRQACSPMESFFLWTVGVSREDVVCELVPVLGVYRDGTRNAAFARVLPRLGVSQALSLRPKQGCFLDQDALAFIMAAGTTETHDDRTQRRVLGGPSGEGGVSPRKVNEIPEAGAPQA